MSSVFPYTVDDLNYVFNFVTNVLVYSYMDNEQVSHWLSYLVQSSSFKMFQQFKSRFNLVRNMYDIKHMSTVHLESVKDE